MKAGIIAAGLGERLKVAGVPKPLVPVAGRPLVHWTAASLRYAGADSITVLLNSKGGAVRASLEAAFPTIEWRFLEWDSPSSWESFRRVCLELSREADRFVVSTVDVLARPEDVARFTHRALEEGHDAALAVTPFVDDEKPLWVDVADGRVSAIGDDCRSRDRVTCGLYGVSAEMAGTLEGRSHERLRDFWMSMARERKRIAAIDIDKTIDLDRPEDVGAAEEFLRAKV
ncbi:MAG: NTP transferase domain-containing protein [Elusimicrobia bacterium]|nr:NTP transferase domain-containing protein [Elusimicrobiota bacterium]